MTEENSELDESSHSAESLRKLIDVGAEHFWSSRGGDPHRKRFNNRQLDKRIKQSKPEIE